MDQVKQTVKYLEAGLTSLRMSSPIVVEQESDTEFNILLPNLGVGILLDTEGVLKRGIGNTESLSARWDVYALDDYPDTREEPGFTDENPRGTYAHIAEAIAGLFEIAVRDRILNMLQAIGEAEQAEELSRG